jgi:hypothetical protein
MAKQLALAPSFERRRRFLKSGSIRAFRSRVAKIWTLFRIFGQSASKHYRSPSTEGSRIWQGSRTNELSSSPTRVDATTLLGDWMAQAVGAHQKQGAHVAGNPSGMAYRHPGSRIISGSRTVRGWTRFPSGLRSCVGFERREGLKPSKHRPNARNELGR